MTLRVLLNSLLIGVAGAALTLAISVGLILAYAYLIAPGHDGAFYQGFAVRVSPILLGIVGVVVFAMTAWFRARAAGQHAGVLTTAPYVLTDIAINLVRGEPATFLYGPFAILAAAGVAAWLADRRLSRALEESEAVTT